MDKLKQALADAVLPSAGNAVTASGFDTIHGVEVETQMVTPLQLQIKLKPHTGGSRWFLVTLKEQM